MHYSIEYFHAKVQATIEAWPVDVVADYARIIELLMEHGPNLRLPHSRAFGGSCLSYAHGENRGLAVRSTVSLLDGGS
jgi:hypothetical protein